MMKFKKVSFTRTYYVPATPDAEDYAREMICEDIDNLVIRNRQQLWDEITIVDAPDASLADVPQCVFEYMEDVS